MKRRGILQILICFAALVFCVRPLPLYAQSGSSTCRVTATAGETEPPPSGDEGEGKEDPEKPEPTKGPDEETGEPETEPTKDTGEPETGSSEEQGEGEPAPEQDGAEPGETESPSKPEGGELPGTGEDQKTDGDSEQETPKPESTFQPGEETGSSDGRGESQEEMEPVQTGEPAPGEMPGDHDGCWRLNRWLLIGLLILGILAALLAGGALRWLWLLFRFLILKKRILFHGILTEEKSPFIRVRNREESSCLVQDKIDCAGNFAEFCREVRKETAVTCLPGQSRMRISFAGQNGRKWARETQAGEQRLFRILKKLEGTGKVEVRITCRGTGIDILLVFRV